MAVVPFRPVPFEQVPDKPVVPHRWAEATRRDITIRTDELGEVRVAVREYGPKDASPLLLVHGMGTASYSWRYMLEPLGAVGGFRLVMPDMPGAGDSGHPDVYLGPDAMANALIAIVDALALRGAPAIANSMGGYLAMRAVLRDPTLFSRLVNEHSPGVPTFKMHALRWAMRLLPSWSIVNWLIRRNPERWIHKNVHYYDESIKSREEHAEFARPLHTREGRRTYYRQLRDTLDTKHMATFVRDLRGAPFPIPLLLVYAPADPIVPPSVGDRLRELVPAASFTKLKAGSHFAHVDAPSHFVDAVLPFLSGEPSARAR
ncbi:MAG TPA: alpha/beta hydrolase [Kofleriaceae bacterium]|nr:alpha/beta hydrolase [Kofleriaceae bacterium]